MSANAPPPLPPGTVMPTHEPMQPAPQHGPDAPSAAGEEDPGAALDDPAGPDEPAPGVTPIDPAEVERKRQASNP